MKVIALPQNVHLLGKRSTIYYYRDAFCDGEIGELPTTGGNLQSFYRKANPYKIAEMRKNSLMIAVVLGLVVVVAVVFSVGSHASTPDKYEGITEIQKKLVKAYRTLCDSEKELKALKVDCEQRELESIANWREVNTR